MDLDGDNTLDKSEIQAFVGKYLLDGHAEAEIENVTNSWWGKLAVMDYDKDGVIQKEEMLAFVKKNGYDAIPSAFDNTESDQSDDNEKTSV